MQEESTRLVGEHKGGRLTSNLYLAKIRDYNFQCLFVKCTCDVILSTKVFNITYVSPAETRCAWQRQQANVNSAAEAAALRATTAVQRRAASGSKIVGENRGDMENYLVTQGSTHRGFC